MDLKRVERLMQRITDIQRAADYSLCMAVVLPVWGYDGDITGHEEQWFCQLTIGKPKGNNDWDEIKMLPAQWFNSQDEAMAAAQAAEVTYPASKRQNGRAAEPIYVITDGEEIAV